LINYQTVKLNRYYVPVNVEGATTHSRLRAAVSEWVCSFYEDRQWAGFGERNFA